MMRCIKLIPVIAMALLCLSGCSSKDSLSVYSDADIETVHYEENPKLKDIIRMQEYLVQIPEDGYASSVCVYGHNVYYAVGFFDSLLDQEQGNHIPFEPKYNTQIRVYNGDTKEDELLYLYDSDRCINTSFMVCNGDYLIWQDFNYGYQGEWNIRGMSLEPEAEKNPEILFNYTMNEGDFSCISPIITEEEIFWYNFDTEKDNPVILYRYDLQGREISVAKEGLDLMSPYERASVSDTVIATFVKLPEEQYRIDIDFRNSGSCRSIQLDTTVAGPLANDKLCVWREGYNYGESSYLYVYDIEKDTLEKIEAFPNRIFSFGIIDKYVIINSRGDQGGIEFYDVENKEHVRLTSEEDTLYLTTFGGNSNNVHTYSVNIGRLKVLNIEILSQEE